MLRYLTLALALVAATPGYAQQKMRWVTSLPPVEYDKPYMGELTIRRAATEEDVRAACPKAAFNHRAFGCSRVLKDRCEVFIVSDKLLKAVGYSYALVLRHELGHCNGWGAGHEGKRLVYDGRAEMPKLSASARELPAYPPIVCMTPDWKAESCKDRAQ
jgi:hypothetical protein